MSLLYLLASINTFACGSPFFPPKFLVKKPVDRFRISGESGEDFQISSDGWLYLERPLDWSREDHYVMMVARLLSITSADSRLRGGDGCDCLQIEALNEDAVVDGPITVIVNVLDINNNAPYFNQSVYTAWVREKSPAGVLGGWIRPKDVEL